MGMMGAEARYKLNSDAVLKEFNKALSDGALDKARRIADANPDLKLAKKVKAHTVKVALANLQNKGNI